MVMFRHFRSLFSTPSKHDIGLSDCALALLDMLRLSCNFSVLLMLTIARSLMKINCFSIYNPLTVTTNALSEIKVDEKK